MEAVGQLVEIVRGPSMTRNARHLYLNGARRALKPLLKVVKRQNVHPSRVYKALYPPLRRTVASPLKQPSQQTLLCLQKTFLHVKTQLAGRGARQPQPQLLAATPLCWPIKQIRNAARHRPLYPPPPLLKQPPQRLKRLLVV